MRTAIRFFVMVALLVLLSPAAWAQVTLPHYDGFNYPGGSTLGGQGNWINNNSGDSILVATGSLSYTGFPASSGNRVTFDGTGVDPTKRFDSTASGTIYYSYLFKVTSLGGMSSDTAGYCSGYYQSPTSTISGALVWHRRNGTGFDIGISTRLTSDKSWSSGQSLNTVYLVVAAYQFVAGATNDSTKLWINPNASTFGKTEPAPTLTAVNNTTDMTAAMRFFIRQDLANTTPFIELDELRIGTTWADVTRAISATYVVDKNAGVTPREFRLEQNYPNPFNPSTNIRFSLEATKVVSLKVMDVLGREVATLVDQTLEPGTYTVKWDAMSYPSGVYFYTVRAGNSLETRRMILAK
ncbi:MAG: T9SS type A sorting domain-containing protein [Ignavibacteriales bacterium]|nr:T9SS type A sorting domain-containing protein [Ignavibacteriales bacterium]